MYHVTQYPEPLRSTTSLAMKVTSRKREKTHCQHFQELAAHQKAGQPKLKGFMRRITCETGIARESVCQMAKTELNFKPYKLEKAHLLTNDNKFVQLQRSHSFLRHAAGTHWERIVFRDKKLFMVEQAHNPQNDRSWSTEAPGPSSGIEHCQNPQAVMVWGGICTSSKTPLVIINKGLKINEEYYQSKILEAVVLSWAQQHFGNQQWTFQQDSAPAHKAKTTQEWCRAHFPDFISSAEWPPYSPHLSHVDYSICSILEARACAKPHKSLELLKQLLL
jgi:inhibitor of nuclear factor kappa-B kinase subunit alpha